MDNDIFKDERLSRLNDRGWRLSHLYKIRDKKQNKITFKMNTAQADFIKNRGRLAVICKSRQLGFSTLMCMVQLDKVLFSRNSNCLMISYNKESAEDLFQRIYFAWNNMPEELKSLWTVDTKRKNQLTFGFGDGSVSTLAVRQSGRSGNYDEIHVSELAKLSRLYPNRANEIVQGTFNASGINTNITVESTPEGVGVFQDMFWNGWNKKPSAMTFKSYFYNWQWERDEIREIGRMDIDVGDEVREYQKKHNERAEKDKSFKKITEREIKYLQVKFSQNNENWKRMRQEFPTTVEEAFMEAGNLLFYSEDVARQNVFVKRPTERGLWKIYEEEDIKSSYTLSCDVAEGVGQDASTVVIIKWSSEKPKVVATFADNHISPDMFAFEIKKYATRYNNALVAVERNNHGLATIVKLKDIYGNIYKEEHIGKTKRGLTGKYGWHTNLATKPKMLYDLSEALEDDLIEIPSMDILNELRTYNKEDLTTTKFNDEQTRHWDLLIALAIGWQMRTHHWAKKSERRRTNRINRSRRERSGKTGLALEMRGY